MFFLAAPKITGLFTCLLSTQNSLRTCHCAECGTWRNLKDNHLHPKAILHLSAQCQKQCSRLRHRLIRELPSPSEGALALFRTFDSGRLSCGIFSLGGAVQMAFALLQSFCSGPLTQGYSCLSLSGMGYEKDFEMISKLHWYISTH